MSLASDRAPRRGLIVANFDCELRFAQESSTGPHKELPAKVNRALTLAAPALAVFAGPEDTLWTPAPLEPSYEGLHCSGPLAECEGYDAILPWGQSDELPLPKDPQSGQHGDQETWQEQLWHLRADSSSAARCNDRRFAMRIEIEDEYTLPHRQIVANVSELDEYIAHSPLGDDDTWVAKAPWSASGRERVRRRGRVLSGEMRIRTQRLLERYGELVIEGWMPRLADYGVSGVVGHDASACRIFPAHQLECDKTGVFRAIRIADRETEARLGPDFSEALQESAQLVCAALSAEGYRGPFGIDAFVYRDRSGKPRLHSLCEINARLSFGLVARAQAEKLGLDEFEFTLGSKLDEVAGAAISHRAGKP